MPWERARPSRQTDKLSCSLLCEDISFALSVLLPFGGVSLKALRLHLEWKLGSGLKDRKLEIRRLAELSLQQTQPILRAGDWKPIPCGSHVADRGRCLFSDLSDLQADGQWHDRLELGTHAATTSAVTAGSFFASSTASNLMERCLRTG